MANRRHHRRRTHRNPMVNPRRHRRRHRRNPGMGSVRGFLDFLKEGALDGAGIFVGRVGSKAITGLTGISSGIQNMSGSPTVVALLQGLSWIVTGGILGYAATRVVGQREGAAVVGGAFDAVYESVAMAAMGISPASSYLGGPGAVGYAVRRAMHGYSATKPMPGNAANAATARRVAGYSANAVFPKSRLIGSGGLAGGRLH